MLSFDEFRAISVRERNKDSVTAPNKASTKPNASKSNKSTVKKEVELDFDTIKDKTSFENTTKKPTQQQPVKKPQSKSWITSLGEFLELHSMQIFYMLLLIVDTFGGFAEIYLLHETSQANNNAAANPSFAVQSLTLKSLKSFAKFSSMVFSLEILLVYIAFGFQSITHLGYLMDLCVLSLQFYLDTKGYGSEIRLLNILRLWRPIRLLNSMVAQETIKREEVVKNLEGVDEELKKAQLEIDNIKLELEKEKEAKLAVENMLVNYKEEVDTLNEALKIAAMDIAEVGQNEDELFTSESEDEGASTYIRSRGGDDEGTASSVTGSERSKKSTSKVEILRTALESNPGILLESKSTFIVHEDGKFERK